MTYLIYFQIIHQFIGKINQSKGKNQVNQFIINLFCLFIGFSKKVNQVLYLGPEVVFQFFFFCLEPSVSGPLSGNRLNRSRCRDSPFGGDDFPRVQAYDLVDIRCLTFPFLTSCSTPLGQYFKSLNNKCTGYLSNMLTFQTFYAEVSNFLYNCLDDMLISHYIYVCVYKHLNLCTSSQSIHS